MFLSPPWGGPDYSESIVFDIRRMTVSEVQHVTAPNMALHQLRLFFFCHDGGQGAFLHNIYVYNTLCIYNALMQNVCVYVLPPEI